MSSQARKPPAHQAGQLEPPDDGLVAAVVAYEVDLAVDEHPPEVGRLTLVPEHLAGPEAHLDARVDQALQLVVAEPVEEGERADVGEFDHSAADPTEAPARRS